MRLNENKSKTDSVYRPKHMELFHRCTRACKYINRSQNHRLRGGVMYLVYRRDGWTVFDAFSALLYCLYVCILYAFVPHLFSHHTDNLFSLWAASIDKHIASLADRHCAFFS